MMYKMMVCTKMYIQPAIAVGASGSSSLSLWLSPSSSSLGGSSTRVEEADNLLATKSASKLSSLTNCGVRPCNLRIRFCLCAEVLKCCCWLIISSKVSPHVKQVKPLHLQKTTLEKTITQKNSIFKRTVISMQKDQRPKDSHQIYPFE